MGGGFGFGSKVSGLVPGLVARNLIRTLLLWGFHLGVTKCWDKGGHPVAQGLGHSGLRTLGLRVLVWG